MAEPNGMQTRTLDEELQSTEGDVKRIVELSEPTPPSKLLVAGQIALGMVFPWAGPKSSE